MVHRNYIQFSFSFYFFFYYNLEKKIDRILKLEQYIEVFMMTIAQFLQRKRHKIHFEQTMRTIGLNIGIFIFGFSIGLCIFGILHS